MPHTPEIHHYASILRSIINRYAVYTTYRENQTDMNEPQHQKLMLKNIHSLLGEQFFIPAYQRGYRWTPLQVKELLDDIWEFTESSNSGDPAFYCLQPVVVTWGNNQWQVVDGQQRLTTLYLILHYLEEEHLRRPILDAYKKALYSISYETRPKCEEFLQEIHHKQSSENIDFFHMSQAYLTIRQWFDDKDFNDNTRLLEILLAKEPEKQSNKTIPEKRSVKVIWYDLSDECHNNQYAIDVFSRLNIGKIPLTNAELVKALFLQSSHFKDDQAKLMQLHIASEWDAIEKRLHDSLFWHFINPSSASNTYTTRIEYIFDLIKQKKPEHEAFYTFHQFSTDFKNEGFNIGLAWQHIKNYLLTFEEWYQDKELYHLIGFLVECGISVRTLKAANEATGRTKTQFKQYLKETIKAQFKDYPLAELSYGEPKIREILLLLNIQTLIASTEADIRFPFDRYKLENWDIEHIRPQTNSTLNGTKRSDWLNDIKNYFYHPSFTEESSETSTKEPSKAQALAIRINALLDQPKIEDQPFYAIYKDIQDFFNTQSIDWGDELGNLTLLDSTTNRSYKNSPFPVKRARIIDNEKKGIFVPLCTKNVFLKYYSRSSRNLFFWEESDAKEYTDAIYTTLKEYLPFEGACNDTN